MVGLQQIVLVLLEAKAKDYRIGKGKTGVIKWYVQNRRWVLAIN